VVATLASTRITTADVIGLRVGDIIASEKDVKDPLVVSVEGKPKFYASPGKYKGRKAIQIRTGFETHTVRVDFPDTTGAGS
jgi:flagellar motor switch protein FliM